LGGGGGSDRDAQPHGDRLTIYSSLPRRGVSGAAAKAVAAGQRLALEDAGARAGRFRLRLVELDSTRPGDQIWNPAQVSMNADRASDDPTSIAYLGELDYGATAVSLPSTNDDGLLQVSPEDGLTSLTRVPPGRAQEGPERYYPTDRRTFLRLTPSDLLQAEALLRLARGLGVRRPAVVSDEGIYGRELAATLVARGRQDGPAPARTEELQGGPAAMADLVRDLREAGTDAVIFAGVAGPMTRPLLAALARQMPQAPVLGSGGLAAIGGQPLRPAPERVEALDPVLPAGAYPASSRALLRRIARREGSAAAQPDALYGYESMRLVIAAIKTGRGDRTAVVRAAFSPKERRSAIGRYRILPSGDTEPERFSLLRLRDGRFTPAGVVR
jgi:branched-chain amino acid transport system substrate-binding protein